MVTQVRLSQMYSIWLNLCASVLLESAQSKFLYNVFIGIFLVQLDLPQTIKIEGGNLSTSYKALQLHLHWGKDGGPGSEHTIDGEQFPMEVR